jgi:hypothetical protein
MRMVDNGRQTTGFLTVLNNEGQPESSLCTLELPWCDNQRGVSCIPTGDYVCTKRDSPTFGDFDESGQGAYHIRTEGLPEVSGRAAVLVHSGNYRTDIRGCIIVGLGFEDLNKDGDTDLILSRKALQTLKQMCGDGFYLKIRDINPKKV